MIEAQSRYANTGILGTIGEKIIVNYLSKVGYTIEMSLDPYDRSKDLLADGLHVEVKTQVPFMQENAFTFKPNQMAKCSSADKLFFIAAPAPKHRYSYEGHVFEVDPKTFTSFTRTTRDGRSMILVPIRQNAVYLVMKLPIETIDLMLKFTVSDY